MDAVKKFFGIKDNNDRIFKTNKSDGEIDKSVKPCVLPAGSVGEIINLTVNVDENGQVVAKNGQYLSIGNKNYSDKIYKFLRANTDVEWTYIRESNDSKPNLISTSHDKGIEYLGINLLYSKFATGSDKLLVTHIHPILKNPLMQNEVSASDKAGVKYIKTYFPNKKVIYRADDMQGGKYDYYNENGVTRHVRKK